MPSTFPRDLSTSGSSTNERDRPQHHQTYDEEPVQSIRDVEKNDGHGRRERSGWRRSAAIAIVVAAAFAIALLVIGAQPAQSVMGYVYQPASLTDAQPAALSSIVGVGATAGPISAWGPVLASRKASPTPARHVQTEKPSMAVTLSVSTQSPGWRSAFASSYGIGDGFLGGHLACGGRLDEVTPVVANKSLPCGTRLTICFTRPTPASDGKRTHCSPAVVRDRGPYVAGRSFDLGPAVARAVHFSGLGFIRWRLS